MDKDFLIQTLRQIHAKPNALRDIFTLVKYPEKAVDYILHGHDMEKTVSYVRSVVEKDPDSTPELKSIVKRLEVAVDSMNALMFNPEKHRDRVLRQYAHNIMACLDDDNRFLLTTSSRLMIKEEVGNKAFHLWNMTKMNLPVPEAFFLTFHACRLSYAYQKVNIGPFLKQALVFFDGPIAIRSSGLESMPGMLDTIFVEDSNDWEKVEAAIMDVIDSWYSDKAKKYRKICKLDDTMNIGVVIQKVVDAKKGFSGVCYSKNPITGEDELTGKVLFNQMGENLVNGTLSGSDINELPKKYLTELKELAVVLEDHYKSVQDIEFACDGEKLYLLQTRDTKITDLAECRIALSLYKKKLIDETRLQRLFRSNYNYDKMQRHFATDPNAKPLAKGLSASYGRSITGVISFNQNAVNHEQRSIYIANVTSTDDLEHIDNSDAVVTINGGFTSHAAEICRKLGKPCIVSASPMEIKNDTVIIGDKTFKAGDVITIISDTGEIFDGEIETSCEFFLKKEYEELMGPGSSKKLEWGYTEG